MCPKKLPASNGNVAKVMVVLISVDDRFSVDNEGLNGV